MMSFTGSTMLKDPLRVRGKRSFKDDLVEGARDPGRVAVLEDVSPESHPGRPRFHRPFCHLQHLPVLVYLRSHGSNDRNTACVVPPLVTNRYEPLQSLRVA